MHNVYLSWGPYTNHVALWGGQAKHHVKPRGGGGLAKNLVTFPPPIFALLFPTKRGNCHLLRALTKRLPHSDFPRTSPALSGRKITLYPLPLTYLVD